MSRAKGITGAEEILSRLGRASAEGTFEKSVVTSPGARATGWAVKIKSNQAYNVYNVRAVVIDEPGTEPSEIGQQMQAVNLAEGFLQAGQLPVGTYVAMFRTGGRNVFYAPVSQ